jgi:ribonuclease M5
LNSKIKEVIVVEGYHDLAKLKAIYPEIDVYITNGSEISENTLVELKVLNESRGLILFLDPDYQGERIRRILSDYVGPTKHAFLTKKDCINKNKTKVGIEHANSTKIIEALSSVYTMKKDIKDSVKISDLYRLGLIGNNNSKALRLLIGETLGIGLNNGKTLLYKINMFGISLEEIEAVLRK